MASREDNSVREALVAEELKNLIKILSQVFGRNPREISAVVKSSQKNNQDRRRKRLNEKEEGFYNSFQQFTGVRITFANILRQSQILNRFVGSVFQLFGGLLDILLISFAPFITAILNGIQNLFPLFENLADLIDGGFRAAGEFFDAIRTALPEPLKNILKSENLVLGAVITAAVYTLRKPFIWISYIRWTKQYIVKSSCCGIKTG